jgi:hypothetical protein
MMTWVFDKKKTISYTKIIEDLSMKKAFLITLSVTNLFFMTNLSSTISQKGAKDPFYKRKYSWELSDAAQEKQATGMIISGVVMTVVIGVLAGLLPTSSSGTAAPQSSVESENTLLEN